LSDWRIGEDAKTMTPVGVHRSSGGSPASRNLSYEFGVIIWPEGNSIYRPVRNCSGL